MDSLISRKKYIDFLFSFQYDIDNDELFLVITDKNGVVLGRVDCDDNESKEKLIEHMNQYLQWEIENV